MRIRRAWMAYRRACVPADAGPVQVIYRAFMAGAATLFGTILGVDEGTEPTANDLRMMDELKAELDAHIAEVRDEKGGVVQELPPAEFSGRNLDEKPHIALDGYHVYSWTPERGGRGKPEQVHVVFELEDPPLNFFMAMKSPRALDELVAALLRHRNDVWPEGSD